MTSVRAVEQTRMGIAALLVSNIGWGVLPLYWHALSGMNAISVLAYRLIATLVVMIALLMAFRRYRAYHAIAALWCAAEQKAVRAGTRRHHGYQRELVAVHISGGQRPGAADLNRVPDYASAQRGAGRGHVRCAVTDVPVGGDRARRQFLRLRSAQTYVPLDAIAQAENDKDMRQWEPLNSMLLISSTLAFARYDDKRMWAYDVIENAMTRNLGYSFSEEYDESAEDNEDTNEVGGQPGPRLNYGPTYYAAFVHDPEGNNIEAMLV
ncbi:hypothetical protein L1K10_07865 [Bifidobacterium bifidum]|nr:hypothetical protein [Bifidobacterium bifidum]MDG5948606.1 hypothetical protein [Bifidobacterium bifidum]MDG5967112.1 hypothetical protein [Bifidobacterium bifidum]